MRRPVNDPRNAISPLEVEFREGVRWRGSWSLLAVRNEPGNLRLTRCFLRHDFRRVSNSLRPTQVDENTDAGCSWSLAFGDRGGRIELPEAQSLTE
jgi:hypothetical protein